MLPDALGSFKSFLKFLYGGELNLEEGRNSETVQINSQSRKSYKLFSSSTWPNSLGFLNFSWNWSLNSRNNRTLFKNFWTLSSSAKLVKTVLHPPSLVDPILLLQHFILRSHPFRLRVSCSTISPIATCQSRRRLTILSAHLVQHLLIINCMQVNNETLTLTLFYLNNNLWRL